MGSNSHTHTLSLVDQSSPNFFGGTREESLIINVFLILDILTRSGDIRDRSLKLSEIAPNFACFWPPISSGGVPSEFLDLHYKAHPYCNHVAKFRGDRPRELGDRVANKILKRKKISRVKHKAFGPPSELTFQVA